MTQQFHSKESTKEKWKHVNTNCTRMFIIALSKIRLCLDPGIYQCDLFSKKVIAGIIRILRSYHPGLSGWALNPETSAQTRKRQREALHTHRHGRKQWGDGGRNWSDVATSLGSQETPTGTLKLEGGKDSFLEPSELWDDKFVVLSHSVCGDVWQP